MHLYDLRITSNIEVDVLCVLWCIVHAIVSACRQYSLLLFAPAPASADNFETWTYYAGTGSVTTMQSYGDVIWCGTEFGLVRWDTSDMSYRIYRKPDGLSHAHIIDLDIAANGDVWVATQMGGIAMFDGSLWETYSTDSGLPYNYGKSVGIDTNGTVWASVYRPDYMSEGGGLSRWDGVSWQSFMINEDVPYSSENIINDFAFQPDGIIWCISADGRSLIKFIDDEWIAIDLSNVKNVVSTTEGVIWATPYYSNNELYRLDDDVVVNVDLPDGFEMSQACEPVAGPDGDLWIVDHEGCVVKITDNTPLLVNDKGDRSLSLRTVTVGYNGTLYGSDSDGSLAVFDGSGWKLYPTDEQNIIVKQIIEDSRGNLWAYGEAGIYKYNGGSWTLLFNSDELPDMDSYYSIKIYVDNSDRVWIFNNHDVYYYDGEWIKPPAFQELSFYSHIEASENTICFSNNYREVSLYSIENGSISNLSLPETFYPDENLSITPHVIDKSGTLWITASKEGAVAVSVQL